MTTLFYLDLETLTIEKKESTRDYRDLLSSAQGYYAKAGVKTMVQQYNNIYYIQERSCKNVIMFVVTDEYSKLDLKVMTDKIMHLPYYSIAKGFKPGIYRTWSQAKSSTDGYAAKKHKKFYGKEAAIEFMRENNAPLVCYDYLIK